MMVIYDKMDYTPGKDNDPWWDGEQTQECGVAQMMGKQALTAKRV
jgi:hypothetical protein